MPYCCPTCRGYYNIMQRLPFDGIVTIECGDCGWVGQPEDLDWAASDEVTE